MERSLQVQIKGKAPDGSEQVTIMEYIEVAREIEFTTSRMDAPGKLKFSCLEDGPIGIPEGSSVEYCVDGTKLFKGYVFTIERTRDGETSYTAYDQLRYLKAKKVPIDSLTKKSCDYYRALCGEKDVENETERN